MARRRVFSLARTIHGYAGVVLCLVLVIIGLSGALLVFKDDYLRATIPAARTAPDLSPAALASIAELADQRYGEVGVNVIVFAKPDFGLHKVYLHNGERVYLDSEGKPVDQWSDNGRIEDWLLDLHHRLLVGKVGVWIVGFVSVAGTLFLAAGVIAYWPTRRAFRRGLTIKSLARPELLTLHRNAGVVLAPMVGIALVTGAILTYPSTSKAIFDVFGANPSVPPSPIADAAQDHTDWAAGFEAATAAFPDAALRIAIWPRDDRPPSVRMKQPQELHPNGRTLVAFSSLPGQPLATQDALNAGAGREAYNAVYPIHAGFVGGRLYDAILATTGIGIALLGAVGSFTFFRRLLSHEKRIQT